MLELIDIKKRYGSKEVLHGISIKFENGIYGLMDQMDLVNLLL